MKKVLNIATFVMLGVMILPACYKPWCKKDCAEIKHIQESRLRHDFNNEECEIREYRNDGTPIDDMSMDDTTMDDMNNEMDETIAFNDGSDGEIAGYYGNDTQDFGPMYPSYEDGEEYDNRDFDAANQFAWAEDVEDANDDNFKVVYFDFDKHGIREDQKEALNHDIAQVKEVIAHARANGQEPTIIIEGHADHAAGSPEYNMHKSEYRAQTVANALVEKGIEQENIKVVAKGQEMPVIIAGKQVTGSAEDQWLNRRVEIRVVNA